MRFQLKKRFFFEEYKINDGSYCYLFKNILPGAATLRGGNQSKTVARSFTID